ncbi:hypothetical protein Y032_0287g1439 [Ancylostoma ceylanicum]|nr:hypothetical protein Y032_0287g1439 [Ancylostoma ceylanicum]
MSFLRKYLFAAIGICVVCTLIISYNCTCAPEGMADIRTPHRDSPAATAAAQTALDETYLLVMIMSSPNDSAVRAVIRDTWLRLSRKGPAVVMHRFPIGTKKLG